MSGDLEEYAINELAKKANVSVRTVRFYINEGLLPAPQTRGRYTVYTDEYLDRLELIRRLKDSFLPLKEIRATLASLSRDEVRATLDDLRRREADLRRSTAHQKKTAPAHDVGETRSRALEYITNLLSSTPVNRPVPPQPAASSAQASPESTQEHWQRVTLADGVELHIRQPLRPEDKQKIDQIVQWFRKQFPS